MTRIRPQRWSHRKARRAGLLSAIRVFLLSTLTVSRRLYPLRRIRLRAGFGTWSKPTKRTPRGPYQAIKWFCPDGSVLPAQERCDTWGGIQHALPKDAVQQLAAEKGIYLGQILAGSSFEDFWDPDHRNARLHHYIMEKYLVAADDGWREFSDRIQRLLPDSRGIETRGPFDIESGFAGDEIWLFQVRPYVENKRARESIYLQNLDKEVEVNSTGRF